MYAMVALLASRRRRASCAPTRSTPSGEGRGSPASRSVAAALYTRNWPIFFTISAAVAWALLWILAAKPRRRELLRDGLLGFGGLFVLYLPWVPTTLYQAAHTGAPRGPTRRRSASLLGVPGVHCSGGCPRSCC